MDGTLLTFVPAVVDFVGRDADGRLATDVLQAELAVVGVVLAGGEVRTRHLARVRVFPDVFVARPVVLAVALGADRDPTLGAVFRVEAQPQGVARFQRGLGLGGGFGTLGWLAFQRRSLR